MDDQRYPPRSRIAAPPQGQDFDTLTRLHGRPRGYFEHVGPPRRRIGKSTKAPTQLTKDELEAIYRAKNEPTEAAE